MIFRFLQAVVSSAVVILIAGCAAQTPANIEREGPAEEVSHPDMRPEARDDSSAGLSALARTADALDTKSEEERRVASARVGAAQTDLGATVASLGSPGEPGFWMKTPLVSSPAQGRVVFPASGKSVNVELVPRPGPATGGSQLSLSAMRAIEAPLTGLPELQVFRLGD